MEVILDESGSVLIANIVGRVDAATTKALEDGLLPSIDAGRNKVLIDCSELVYISSAGLRVFLMAAKKVKIANGLIVLSGMQAAVKNMFEIAGFTAFFPILPTREEGLAQFDA